MTAHQKSPFKEGEVNDILKRLTGSFAQRNAEAVLQQAGFAGLLQDNEFEQDEANQDFSDLDELLAQHSVNLTAKSRAVAHSSPESLLAIERGLFAGEPSYVLQRNPGGEKEAKQDASFLDELGTLSQADWPLPGVNAKSSRSKRHGRTLSTPGRAGLVANFHLSHAERLVAINNLRELDPILTDDQIKKLLKIDAFVHTLVLGYQGSGELPDWAKFVTPEMKQFFRIYLLSTKPGAKTITIRLDHETAEAALAGPRPPANYLGEIIKRTLAKHCVETDMTFTLEFNHTGRTENHPAHIHGTLCIPDDRVNEVTEALRNALAEGYRQRYKNVAVHIGKPRSAHWWAAYCAKEYGTTAIKLTTDRGRKTRPDYAARKLTQDAKAFYENISAWLGG
jgi:hypothetical protein